MKAQFKQYKITATYTGDRQARWSEDNWNSHRVTVYNTETGKECMFWFWGSIAYPKLRSEYEVLNAFYCFVSDALCGEYGYEEFCDEFGYELTGIYNEDNKYYRLWKACQSSLKKAQSVINGDIYDLANDLGEVAA